MSVKRAIVVGATSGMGRQTARLLAQAGYRVGVCGRRQELLDSLVGECPESYFAQEMDITSEQATTKLESLIERMGGVELLVLSAGTGFLNERLASELELQTTALNVDGFTRIMDYAYHYMASYGGGHLVGISSIMALRGSGESPAYSASKAYQLNYMEGLRQRSRKQKHQIHVTDIRAGAVDTAMLKGEGFFWVATPERAAEVIVRAIASRKRVAYVTPRWGVIALLLKLLPRSLYEKL